MYFTYYTTTQPPLGGKKENEIVSLGYHDCLFYPRLNLNSTQ
jgi:hypothetical protein